MITRTPSQMAWKKIPNCLKQNDKATNREVDNWESEKSSCNDPETIQNKGQIII